MHGLVNFKRLACSQCSRIRWHEVMLGMAKCQHSECGYVRQDCAHEEMIIEKFIN